MGDAQLNEPLLPGRQLLRRRHPEGQVVEADPLMDMRNQILKPVSFFNPKA